MNNSIDHERCSELLADFLGGKLGSHERNAVQGHLDGCARCSAEVDALRAVMALEPADLTEVESDRLRQGVRDAVLRAEPTEASPVVALPARRNLLMPALGVAAVIAAIAVFAASGLFGSAFIGGRDQAGEGAGRIADVEVAEIRDRLQFRGVPAPTIQRSTLRTAAGTAGGGGGGSDEESATFDSAQKAPAAKAKRLPPPTPKPVFVRFPGRLNDARVTMIGRYGVPLVLFPRAYSAADAGAMEENFLNQLANAAPTQSKSTQIADCGAPILARPQPILPALATFGTMDGEQILLLAFAWSEDNTGKLDRYMVWTWPLGDCNAVPDYRAGFIKT